MRLWNIRKTNLFPVQSFPSWPNENGITQIRTSSQQSHHASWYQGKNNNIFSFFYQVTPNLRFLILQKMSLRHPKHLTHSMPIFLKQLSIRQVRFVRSIFGKSAANTTPLLKRWVACHLFFASLIRLSLPGAVEKYRFYFERWYTAPPCAVFTITRGFFRLRNQFLNRTTYTFSDGGCTYWSARSDLQYSSQHGRDGSK